MIKCADAERAGSFTSTEKLNSKQRRLAASELPDVAFVEDITAELTRLGMPEYQARMIARDTQDYRSAPSQPRSLQRAA